MNFPLKFEICIDSVEAALASEIAGAHRVELCSNLLEGGTTPSAGMVAVARKCVKIGLQVMIRPRGGDFCYSDAEFQVMKQDIKTAKDLGADGVVFGLLTPEGEVDVKRTQELADLASPLNVTFHRAFDMTRDPFDAMEAIISIGADRILTSGQEVSVLEGLDLIKKLHKKAKDRIIIMPGGGITERNIKKIVKISQVTEVHFASLEPKEGKMVYRNRNCFMGGELRPAEFSFNTTTAKGVTAVIQAAL